MRNRALAFAVLWSSLASGGLWGCSGPSSGAMDPTADAETDGIETPDASAVTQGPPATTTTMSPRTRRRPR